MNLWEPPVDASSIQWFVYLKKQVLISDSEKSFVVALRLQATWVQMKQLLKKYMLNKEKLIRVTLNEAENIFIANQIMTKYFYCKKKS